MMFAPPYKPTIWQRIKWFFCGKPKYEVPVFKSLIVPVIKSDWPNLNRNVFTEESLKMIDEVDNLNYSNIDWSRHCELRKDCTGKCFHCKHLLNDMIERIPFPDPKTKI